MASYYSPEMTEWNSEIEEGEPEMRTSPMVFSPEEETAMPEVVASAESDSDEEDDGEVDFWYLRRRDERQRKEVEEDEDEEREEELVVEAPSWPRRGSGAGVMLEGYVEAADGDDQRSSASVARTKSLTDDDLEELKGCLDLGFGFNYEEIPELCNTLPALELCYSMSQRFLDEQQQRSPDRSSVPSSSNVSEHSQSPASAPIANWKISSPGDDPDEVKARLKYWAQAVACTVRLCS